MSATVIGEFIQALDEEINAIKRGKGGSVVKVFNGRFLRQASGLHVYLFHLENFLAILDEAPAEIEIAGKRYQAQVLVTQGLEVEIGIEQFCGDAVAEARLHTNLWYLLELLKKKYEGYLDGSIKVDFSLSELLFFGDHFKVKTVSDNLQYSISKDPPNEAQKKAIVVSFSFPISIIWGPPGTGKTKTIAKSVEAHLRAGRRVLVVSHANNAVDEALEDVADHLKDSAFYQEGKLIRLGKPQEEHLQKLESEFPLVLPERIASKLAESLVAEQNALLRDQAQQDATLSELGAISSAFEQLKTLKSETNDLGAAVRDSNERLHKTRSELAILQQAQEVNQSTLIEAQQAGKLKRIFKGYNPQKIQRGIDRVSVEIDTKGRILQESTSRYSDSQTSLMLKQTELQGIEANVTAQLRRVGMSAEEIERRQEELQEKRSKIRARLSQISEQLDEIQKTILADAKLVATTLTKTFSSKQFPNTPFDVLFIDEASMAPLPYVYWAASRCRSFVTVVGDFLQLPPICIADDQPMAKKWLGKSIFDVMGITTADGAHRHARVNLLDTQYRMAPEISCISNQLFYEGKLKDHHSTFDRRLDDGVSQSSLVLIETSAVNPWCSRLSAGSRFNLYNALLSATLAKRLLQNMKEGKIGIITPYAPQARLINKIANDWQLLDRLRISTVHRFQGGEESIIIFDSTEGAGTRIAPMLDDTARDSQARLLLNVAITRAKHKFYFVGNTKYLLAGLGENSALTKIIKHLLDSAEKRDSAEFVDNYFTSDFDKWSSEILAAPVVQQPFSGRLYTEKNFWAQFLNDIKTVKERLIIMSPFLSTRRSGIFMDYFESMVRRGIHVRVYTKPKDQQIGEMVHQADLVIDKLRSIGATVIERSKMHQKVAILDNKIAWDGSLNILSHRDTGEQMRRFEGPSAIEELIKNLELAEDFAPGNLTDETCPKCSSPMVVRKSKYGTFLSCSTYPRCDGKIDSRARGGSTRKQSCPACSKPMVVRRSARGPFLGCSGYPSCRKTMKL